MSQVILCMNTEFNLEIIYQAIALLFFPVFLAETL